MASIILISIELMAYTSGRFRFFMAQGIQEPEHVWLVMMKAMRALTRYAAAGIEETGLGLTDFGVLEVLLHKGPLPVNTIGPIVDLTPGSISIAVDRLFARAWSAESRAAKTGASGSLPWPRAGRISSFQPAESIPGR
jgi:MarR family 2-MHQ and catechol resistance regulon transcriptional repressor